ncbi:putative TetR family transcriptional regulator [Rhodococcus erythropolis]|uniref:Putative TetR family transcriptional regulator n=1 Tax=Rhodococcus erythropolis TaxID=1833 RepID=A0A6G9CMK0_RHOER|nr:hypothetical protein [Rhodococcus erythropolis]QIP38108.1 putative TetR family transcriptional regulator [Rhodococcus erythropolis]
MHSPIGRLISSWNFLPVRRRTISALARHFSKQPHCTSCTGHVRLSTNSARGPSDPAALTAEYLDDLLSHRRHELIARYALLLETPRDSALHQLLEGSLFSLEKARPVFETVGVDNPDVSAANFLSLLEGLIFDYCLGSRSRDPHSSETVRQLRIPIDIYLHGVGVL